LGPLDLRKGGREKKKKPTRVQKEITGKTHLPEWKKLLPASTKMGGHPEEIPRGTTKELSGVNPDHHGRGRVQRGGERIFRPSIDPLRFKPGGNHKKYKLDPREANKSHPGKRILDSVGTFWTLNKKGGTKCLGKSCTQKKTKSRDWGPKSPVQMARRSEHKYRGRTTE